ncbi:MAG: hypothetical protein J3R72DRAFT_498746 [Linnemannia gamsii]|nr:MAG: hypothetical protein J3R72DRAFT_498746 [Linnemannia gamsii]
MKKKTNVGQAPALAAAAQEESMNESAASMTEKHEKRISQIKGAKLIFDQAFKHELINKGMIVSDGKLVENLWHTLLDCEPEVGVLVDGFTRSEVQVECLKLFHERMHERRKEPTLQICVLYVDEEISINHQLMRRKLIKEHNAKVMRSGKGEFMEERVTDFDEIPSPFLLAHAELITWIFKDHYPCLLKLSKIFPFHLINAVGSIDSVMRIILKEFQYHSSLELDHNTYEAISHIPLATKIGTHAQPEIFSKTVRFIDQEVSPIFARHSISGQALVRSDNTILPTPRLWRSSSRVLETPKRVDSKAFEITLET